jgi:hypothetical protein
MDKTVKALIIVVIILVAVLGAAGGFILQGYMSNSNKNVVVNQTNSSINNTPNHTTSNQATVQKSQPAQNKTLSAAQAIGIANKYAAGFGEKATGSADYLSGIGMYDMANGDPYYHVELQWITPHNSGNSDDILTASYVEIDAKTGAVNPRD